MTGAPGLKIIILNGDQLQNELGYLKQAPGLREVKV